MDFINSIQFLGLFGFPSDLELSNSFTNLIGGIVSATLLNVVQKIERIWMDILCGFITSTIEATRVLESRPWPVADRPSGGRGPSGPVVRTLWPPSTDSPDPDRAMHFFSL
jgi:hypothetical protein